MRSESSISQAVSGIAPTFSGELLRPDEAGYDEVRRVHNGMVDKKPALIARCRGVADVVDAINIARDLGLEVAVRGGGHNVAGRATVEGGLMIDLSLMKGIHVDPTRRTVRAQGGATWADLNRETQWHGLAVTGGVVSTTGIAGLTLGGGIGWLMGKHGLALANLRAVDLVTPEGRVLRASDEEHPDLFWAVRGGGGNFGVVTSFEYRLVPVGLMVAGGLSLPNRLSVTRAQRKNVALPPILNPSTTVATQGGRPSHARRFGARCGSLRDRAAPAGWRGGRGEALRADC